MFLILWFLIFFKIHVVLIEYECSSQTNMPSDSHSEKGQIYILMEDKVGQIIPKIINSNTVFQPVMVLKGGLFQEQEKQPEYTSNVSLVSIDNPHQILETCLKDIRIIPKDHAEMLLAVPSYDDRYDILTNRYKLKKASIAKKGDQVSIDLENVDPKGILMYKGLIHKHKGVYFGVKLNVSIWDYIILICYGITKFYIWKCRSIIKSDKIKLLINWLFRRAMTP